MSASKETVLGRVEEMLPNAEVKVAMPDGKTVRCYLSGKMRINSIRVVIGDSVEVVLPQGSAVGRVVRRR